MIKHKSITSYFISLLAFAIIVTTPSHQAFAQEGAALEELVVTARKREENILDVPLSITALTDRKSVV